MVEDVGVGFMVQLFVLLCQLLEIVMEVGCRWEDVGIQVLVQFMVLLLAMLKEVVEVGQEGFVEFLLLFLVLLQSVCVFKLLLLEGVCMLELEMLKGVLQFTDFIPILLHLLIVLFLLPNTESNYLNFLFLLLPPAFSFFSLSS